MLLIYQDMLLFLKISKICTYTAKISKKEHIYPIFDYIINKHAKLKLNPQIIVIIILYVYKCHC